MYFSVSRLFRYVSPYRSLMFQSFKAGQCCLQNAVLNSWDISELRWSTRFSSKTQSAIRFGPALDCDHSVLVQNIPSEAGRRNVLSDFLWFIIDLCWFLVATQWNVSTSCFVVRCLFFSKPQSTLSILQRKIWAWPALFSSPRFFCGFPNLSFFSLRN